MITENDTQRGNGLVTERSARSVEEIVSSLTDLLAQKGITLFATVDHSGEAAKVGFAMPSTKLLIFGNPKGGTPAMLAAPSCAIDLPLKILVAEDGNGTHVSYNATAYLQARHGIPSELIKPLEAAANLVKAVL